MKSDTEDPFASGFRSSLVRFGAGQILALLVAVALIVLVFVIGALGQLFPPLEVVVLQSVIGGSSGLISLTAAWMALGPFGWNVRLVASPLAALGILLLVAVVLAAIEPIEELALASFIAGVAQYVLLQSSYWLFRWWWGLRIVHVKCSSLESGGKWFQFRLWEMLLVTTLVALVLGIGRGVAGFLRITGNGGAPGHVLLVVFTLLVGYNLLLAWPLIWSVLSPTGTFWKTAIALTLGLLVTATEMPAAESFLGAGPPGFFWLINIPQMTSLLAHLVATRICGYRLVRWT